MAKLNKELQENLKEINKIIFKMAEVRDHSDSDDVGHRGGQCDGLTARVRHTEQCQNEDDTTTQEERIRPDHNAGQRGSGRPDDHIEQ